MICNLTRNIGRKIPTHFSVEIERQVIQRSFHLPGITKLFKNIRFGGILKCGRHAVNKTLDALYHRFVKNPLGAGPDVNGRERPRVINLRRQTADAFLFGKKFSYAQFAAFFIKLKNAAEIRDVRLILAFQKRLHRHVHFRAEFIVKIAKRLTDPD